MNWFVTLNTQNILRYFLQHINQHPSQHGNSRITLYNPKKLEKTTLADISSFIVKDFVRAKDIFYMYIHIYLYTTVVQLECFLFYIVIMDKHFVFHNKQYKNCTFISVLPCEQRPFDLPRWSGRGGPYLFPSYLGINKGPLHRVSPSMKTRVRA